MRCRAAGPNTSPPKGIAGNAVPLLLSSLEPSPPTNSCGSRLRSTSGSWARRLQTQSGSPSLAMLSRSTSSALAAASMSASTGPPCCAVVGGPSGRHRHRADLGAARSTCDAGENHCGDGDAGLGREVGERCLGGLGGVDHADAGHRHDDFLAADRAEVEVPTVDDDGGVRVEGGAGQDGVGFGGEGGQHQRARLAGRMGEGRCVAQRR